MDNLTHSLVGLAVAKSGLEKLSPGATTLCVLAANAPDADIVVLLFADKWSFLHHHRGITHSIVGTLSLALLFPLLFFLGDKVVARLKQRPSRIRFKNLLLVSLIASFTHPLLDWTNSYGIRPLLPWNSKWFYGDFVFIVDPFLWIVLGGACFLLSTNTRFLRIVWILLGAVVTLLIIAAPRGGNLSHPWLLRGFWMTMLAGLIFLHLKKVGDTLGSKVALGGLALSVLYWGLLILAHAQALARGYELASGLVYPNESISRLAAMPTLANPLAWDCVFETEKATYRFMLNLDQTPATRIVRYEKPFGKLETALRQVSTDRRTEIFLGFARFPVVRLADPDCTTQTLVQLADLRYTEPGRSRGTFSLELPIDCPVLLNKTDE